MARPKGAKNKVTIGLKEAILKAASSVGYDGKGKCGLDGYLQKCAETDSKTYLGLIGRIVPHVLEGNPEKPLEHKLQVVFVGAGERE